MTDLKKICDHENLSLQSHQPLSGGDINDVYLLHTNQGEIVAKVNKKDAFPGMFQKEKKGLEELKKANAFVIPEVIGVGALNNTAYLLLEYLPETTTSLNWAVFGEKLSKLHSVQRDSFGFEDNYIGSLPQPNSGYSSASEFYIEERLKPQFQLAEKNGYSFKGLDKFYQTVSSLIPDEKASLIHGDLWSGNYLKTERGFALIDPAVCYSIKEMDLAMMKLFGGFSQKAFAAYQSNTFLEDGFEERTELYQLYYLLVHLNLFGSAYLGRVRKCMNRYR